MIEPDPTRDVWSIRTTHPRARRVRPDFHQHRHTYPDGRRAEVLAQYLFDIDRTLYRWRIDGQRIGTTVAGCTGDVPPDWTRPPRPRHQEADMPDLAEFAPARLLRHIAGGDVVILVLPVDSSGEPRYLLALRGASRTTEFPADLLETYEELVKTGFVTGPGHVKNARCDRYPAPPVVASKMGLAPREHYPAEVPVLTPTGAKLHARWSALKAPEARSERFTDDMAPQAVEQHQA